MERDYACAPNDIWSLGVILVNLTCGRNPWKKAAKEDSTFRAFLKDPNFLKSILPVSHELNQILKRVFEMDPEKRITVQELKSAMLNCHHLTTTNDLPPTPPQTPAHRPNRRQEINTVKPALAVFPQQRPVAVPRATQCEWQDSASSDEDALSETDSIPSLASGSSCDEAIEFEEADEPLSVYTPVQEMPAQQSYFLPQQWQQAHVPCGFSYQQTPPSPPPEDVSQQTYFQAQQGYEWPQQQLYVQPQPKGIFSHFTQTFQHYSSNCRQMPLYC